MKIGLALIMQMNF